MMPRTGCWRTPSADLPVMDHEGRVVGMISVRDLLRPLLSDGPDVWESTVEQ